MLKTSLFKKWTSLFLAVLLVLSFNSHLNAFAEDIPVKEINILSFNDFHGSMKPDGKNIGAAKLAAEISRIKAENPNTLVLSAGDIYQGSAMSNLTYGEPVSEMLKVIGVSASAIGNHEFDWGLEHIEKWSKDGGFDFLASNIYNKITNEPVTWAKPYKVVDIGGIKIGLIGITTPESAYKTKPTNVAGLEFKDPAESAKLWADKLKNGDVPEGKIDVVIALTHLGSFQDSKTGEITGEAASICGIPNIDAVISAHSHQTVSGIVDNTPIVQAYYNGRTLVKLTIKVDTNNKVTEILPSIDELYKRADSLGEDPTVKSIYDSYDEKLKPILDEVLATTDKDLGHDKNEGVSLLGEWSCDVMKKAAGTQIAITNGGGLRVPIPKGDITMGKMYEVMPFDNTLCKMELSGLDIKKVIENGIDNTSIGWVQFSGMRVYYNPDAPAGGRITSMRLLDGTKIESDKYYTVVTNDFMFTGGDGYDFSGSKDGVDMGIPIRDALVEELKEAKSLSLNYEDYAIDSPDPANANLPDLPETNSSTSTYNLLDLGGLILVLGVIMFLAEKKKRNMAA